MKSCSHVLMICCDQLMELPLGVIFQIRRDKKADRMYGCGEKLEQNCCCEPECVSCKHRITSPYFTTLTSALRGSCERSIASSSTSPPGLTGISAGSIYLNPRSSLSA